MAVTKRRKKWVVHITSKTYKILNLRREFPTKKQAEEAEARSKDLILYLDGALDLFLGSVLLYRDGDDVACKSLP